MNNITVQGPTPQLFVAAPLKEVGIQLTIYYLFITLAFILVLCGISTTTNNNNNCDSNHIY